MLLVIEALLPLAVIAEFISGADTIRGRGAGSLAFSSAAFSAAAPIPNPTQSASSDPGRRRRDKLQRPLPLARAASIKRSAELCAMENLRLYEEQSRRFILGQESVLESRGDASAAVPPASPPRAATGPLREPGSGGNSSMESHSRGHALAGIPHLCVTTADF